MPENRYTSVLKLWFEHGQSRKQQVDVISGNQQIRIAEKNEGRALCLLSRENRAKVGVCGDDDTVLFQGLRQNFLVPRRLHYVCSDVNCIMPGCHKEVRYARG